MHILMVMTKSYRQKARVAREARALAAAGHRVTVLEWARHMPHAASTDQDGAVHVERINPASSGNIMLAMRRWWRAATQWATAAHGREPFDAVHCHDLDTLPVGVRLKRRLGLRLVYDANEVYWMMAALTSGRIVQAVTRMLEKRLLRHVDSMVTSQDAFTEHYRPLAPCHVYTSLNCPPLEDVPDEKLPARPTAGYFGSLDGSRLFPAIVEAAGSEPGLEMRIAGKAEGAFAAVEQASGGRPNVHYLGALDHDLVLHETAACHVIISPLDPSIRLYQLALPNKLFEAMAAGRPCIASEGTAAASFIQHHGVGTIVRHDPRAFIEEALRLAGSAKADEMGRRGRELCRRTYNASVQLAVIVAIYQDLEASA